MIHWGNDIVALNEFSFKNSHNPERWIDKVCTEKEKEWLFLNSSIQQSQWRIWTFKESAYKVLMKLGVSPFQNPRRIEIKPEGNLTNEKMHFEISFDRYNLYGYSIQNDKWVYSICSNSTFNNQTYHSKVISHYSSVNHSKVIRDTVKDQLKNKHGIKIKSINQSIENIPIITCQNPEVAVDISITHHLPYSAYVYFIHQLT